MKSRVQEQQAEQPPLLPPTLPPGYEQIGDEVWSLEQRWITYATYGRKPGVLIYTDGTALSFYSMEEAVTLLYALFAYGDALIEECDSAYLHAPEHAAGRQLLRSVFPAALRRMVQGGEQA